MLVGFLVIDNWPFPPYFYMLGKVWIILLILKNDSHKNDKFSKVLFRFLTKEYIFKKKILQQKFNRNYSFSSE